MYWKDVEGNDHLVTEVLSPELYGRNAEAQKNTFDSKRFWSWNLKTERAYCEVGVLFYVNRAFWYNITNTGII
jgi:hypothetical protein